MCAFRLLDREELLAMTDEDRASGVRHLKALVEDFCKGKHSTTKMQEKGYVNSWFELHLTLAALPDLPWDLKAHVAPTWVLADVLKSLLAVPAGSYEVERTFSGLGWILSPRRLRMKFSTMDHLVTMRQNYRQENPQTRKRVRRIDPVELAEVVVPVLPPPVIQDAVVEEETETEFETTSEDTD